MPYTPPSINYPPPPYQTTPSGLVHPGQSRRTRAKNRSIKAAKAPEHRRAVLEDRKSSVPPKRNRSPPPMSLPSMSAEDVLSPHEIDDEKEKESLPETAFQAPHGGYHVDYARPKFGMRQARSTYHLWKEDSTPTPPRWTGIPAGLGKTSPADFRRRRALPRGNLKRDHETLNLPPNGSEDLFPYFRSPNPVTERHENDRPRFEPPTPPGEILNAAAQTAEVNRQLEQQRKHRKDYLNDVWQRPHEPPVQSNRPETAEGTAFPSSQIMYPAMLQQQRAAQQAFMHRQQRQAMIAHQQGGSVLPDPMESLNQARPQQLQAVRNGQMGKGPLVDLPPHLIQQQQSMGPQHQDAMAQAAQQQAQQLQQMQAQQQAIAMKHAQSQSSNHSQAVHHPHPANPLPPPHASPGAWAFPGGQQIDRSRSPEILTPTQEETMRNLGSQQTTAIHASSESARTQSIDEFDNRSPAITNDRTFCSGHRFTRGELKYTISEDRTTDAFKRRKVHFIALGQPNSRAAKVEAPTTDSRHLNNIDHFLEHLQRTAYENPKQAAAAEVRMTALEERKNQVGGYAKRPAELRQTAFSDSSGTHRIRTNPSMFQEM